MRVLVAGGGIGGLVLALMLREAGIACQVYEAAETIKPLGVGINTLPHCIRELAALGLLPALDRVALRTRSLRYANHHGQTIWSEPRGLHAGHDAPQFSIHRGFLHALLWQAADERLDLKPIRDRRLVSFAQDEDGVSVRLRAADGTVDEDRGDVLIGADGIHSAVRAALHPDDSGIAWTGIQMWRGAVDWPLFDNGDAMVVAGDGVAKLVLYPIGLGTTPQTRLTNWVIYARVAEAGATPPQRESWSRRGRYADFRHFVERLSLPFIDVGAMIEATPEIFEYPMADREPLPWWSRGRVTLLGDAAHPMYPVGSNGAAQAILDGRSLANALARSPATQALADYEADRRPATTAIVRSNRNGGPERVIDFAAERAPEGFARIEDVASAEEIAAIVRGYASLAGFALSHRAR